MILRRFLPILIIAFITGTLFRIADQYGVALFRMFGTWGIVAIGIWGAAILRGLQREEGLRQLEERLEEMAGAVEVRRLEPVNKLPVWMLKTPGGEVILAASDVSNSMRREKAMTALGRQARAVVEHGKKRGLLRPGESTKAALVMLRRRLKEKEDQLKLSDDFPPIVLLNPEGLPELVGRAG